MLKWYHIHLNVNSKFSVKALFNLTTIDSNWHNVISNITNNYYGTVSYISWYFLSPVICYSLVSWSVATGTSTVWVIVEFWVVVVPGPFTSVGRIDRVHVSCLSGNKYSVFTAKLCILSALCLLTKKLSLL